MVSKGIIYKSLKGYPHIVTEAVSQVTWNRIRKINTTTFMYYALLFKTMKIHIYYK